MNTSKKDNEIMSLLNVNEISRVICDTDKGTLKLKIRKGTDKYFFLLDAVELNKETNKELFALIYPKAEGVAVSSVPKEVEKVINKIPIKKAKKVTKKINERTKATT